MCADVRSNIYAETPSLFRKTAGLAAAGSECCTTDLDLSGNQFDDDAGAKIAFALQHVTGVSSVILYDNG